MEGHHLILGNTTDFLTGKQIVNTHDEQYRQKIARFFDEPWVLNVGKWLSENCAQRKEPEIFL